MQGMIWEDALKALQQGLKVKLPEWTGYWFVNFNEVYKPDEEPNIIDRIRVFSRTGDIFDTPYFDKYVDRTDWEITDGSLGFDFAIVAMKAGNKVRRAGWDDNVFAWLHNPNGARFFDKELLPVFCLRTANNKIVQGFQATQIDMYAEDWEIYSEPVIIPDVLGLHS